MAEAVGKLADFEAAHPSVSEKEWVSVFFVVTVLAYYRTMMPQNYFLVTSQVF